MRLRLILPNKAALAFYFAVLAAALWLFAPHKISTDLLGIFPQNEQTRQLKIAASLESLNRLVVLSNGLDKASRERIESIAAKLEGVEGIESLLWRIDDLTSDTAAALQKQYLQRVRLNKAHLESGYIRQKLEKEYERMSSSFLFVPLNTSDPLELFEDPMRQAESSSRGGYATLEGRGYLLTAMLDVPVSDVASSQALYSQVRQTIEPYGGDVIAFAPHFFTAENSAKIKREVNIIITATLLLLLLFYAFALRDFKILLLSSLALSGSLFVGLAVVTALFEQVSVFTIAFGSGIAMMAVDYLFHYYFHGYYAAAHKERRKVLYAFLTTAGGFGMLSFADFPLIQQLSLFGIVALAFSYFQFTFLFASWPLVPKPNRFAMPRPAKGTVRPLYVTLAALLLIGVGISQLRFDADLRQLDYHNEGMTALQRQFEANASKEVPLLIYAQSYDGIVKRAEQLESELPNLRSIADLQRSEAAYDRYGKAVESIDFTALRAELEQSAETVGFRAGLFADAYRFAQKLPPYQRLEPALLKRLGFETKALVDGRWVSVAYAPAAALSSFGGRDGVVVLQTSALLKKGVEGVLTQLMAIGAFTLATIIVLLYLMLGRSMVRALNYILVPLATIIFVLSLIGTFSVMHLFALIIVMVAGIDYGIYMSRPEERTDEAIYYAMLTTFAGFGIFVFSHIGALHHIGTVISLGIAATFILQRLQLREG
jgi:predicted exporter